MEQKTIDNLSAVSDTLTDEDIRLEIDILPVNKLHATFQKWKLLPSKRVFLMKRITLGNLTRISKLLLSIDLTNFNSDKILECNYALMEKHGEAIAEIVAIAIVNTKKYPSKDIISFLLFNTTAKELTMILSLVLKQMDVTNFMSSIISIRGLNVLEIDAKPIKGNEVSPSTQGR